MAAPASVAEPRHWPRRRALTPVSTRATRALLLLTALAHTLNPTAARAPLVAPDQLPLSTTSRWIVDAKGDRVKWSCVNWSGAEEKDGVVGGLQHQNVDSIAAVFVGMGFNCVRLPWSVQAVITPHNVSNATLLGANPHLIGRSTLQLLDAVVDACAAVKLMVIMDNHMSDGDWCCSETDQNGLWYNDRWPESEWIASHQLVAQRYANQPYVVAGELRNELRGSVVGGVKRSPTWGTGDKATDWRGAAMRAATAILKERPSGYLIVVDNIAYSTDFTGVYSHPIDLPVAGRLVYSAHDYSWSQSAASKDALWTTLGSRWGFLLAQGKDYTAPVWVSEFGTWHDGRNMGSDTWWAWFLEYLQHADIDHGYWRGDGTESRGTGRTFGAAAGFGVLNTTWNGPADKGELLAALQPLQAPTQGPGVVPPLV